MKMPLNLWSNDFLRLNQKKANDLIWILEHEEIYTAGTSFKEK